MSPAIATDHRRRIGHLVEDVRDILSHLLADDGLPHDQVVRIVAGQTCLLRQELELLLAGDDQREFQAGADGLSGVLP